MARKLINSNVDWLREIPEKWEIKRLGMYFRERNVKVNDTDFPPLSVTKFGIVPQLDSAAKSKASDNRKQVLVNDFVINSRSDRKGSCGISKLEGSVSLICTVLKPFKINENYSKYLLDNCGFAEEFYRWGHGIVDDLWTTRYDKMKKILIPFPNFDEQIIISKFLDKKVEKIDKLLQVLEDAIAKLEEYKESIISKYVSKILFHKDEASDDFSFERVVRLDTVCRIIRGNTPFKKDELKTDSDYVGLQYGKVYKHSQIDDSYDFYVDKMFYKESQMVEKGDTIIVSTSETMEDLGHTCYYNRKDIGLLGGEQMMLKPHENQILGKFLYYCAIEFSKKLRVHATGLKVFRYNTGHLKNIFIEIPNISYQSKVIEFLDKKIPKTDQLIQTKKDKIEKLNEYKKSLIYEAVTGKIEVM